MRKGRERKKNEKEEEEEDAVQSPLFILGLINCM